MQTYRRNITILMQLLYQFWFYFIIDFIIFRYATALAWEERYFSVPLET